MLIRQDVSATKYNQTYHSFFQCQYTDNLSPVCNVKGTGDGNIKDLNFRGKCHSNSGNQVMDFYPRQRLTAEKCARRDDISSRVKQQVSI